MNSGNWTVVVDPRAAQDLKKLRRQHHPILPDLIRAIDGLAHQPHAGKFLKGDKGGSHSLRIGDFRILYDLHPSTHTLHIIRAGDRKDIYR